MGMRLSLVMVQAEMLGLLAQNQTELLQLLLHAPAERRLSMDKEWHGIYFLLTGEPWPADNSLAMAIFGAQEIGEDMGYGPARTLDPDQVRDIAIKLSQISTENLRNRFDVQAMTEMNIYPEVWEREGVAALNWLLAAYRKLVEFYGRASLQGTALVLAIL